MTVEANDESSVNVASRATSVAQVGIGSEMCPRTAVFWTAMEPRSYRTSIPSVKHLRAATAPGTPWYGYM